MHRAGTDECRPGCFTRRVMEFYGLILGVLGVWRITHLLQAEDGPWDVIARLRRALGEGFRGRLLDCFYCLSLWIAAPFAAGLGGTLAGKLLLWPALSGAAILLERMTAPAPSPSAPYWKEEDPDVLLRKEESQR
jgi:hypothetical protein